MRTSVLTILRFVKLQALFASGFGFSSTFGDGPQYSSWR